jgi:hypothetical protein
MNESEKMDDLLARKLQSQHTDFEEAKWEQALKLIEANELKKWRGKIFFLYLSVLVLALAVAGAFWLYYSSEHPAAASSAAHQTKQAAPLAPVQSGKYGKPETSGNGEPAAVGSPASRTPGMLAPGTLEEASAPSAAEAVNHAAASSSPSSPIPSPDGNSAEKKNTVTKELPKSVSPAMKSPSVVTDNRTLASPASMGNEKNKNKKTSVPVASVGNAEATAGPESNAKKGAKKPSEDNAKNTNQTATTISEKNPAGVSDISTPSLQKTPASAAGPGTLALAKTKDRVVNSTVPPSSLPSDSAKAVQASKKDSAKAAPVSTAIAPVPATESTDRSSKMWCLSLGAGVNYLLGATINPTGGIFLTRAVSKRWEVGTGLQYTALRGSSHAVNTVVADTFSFGVKNTNTQITNNKLHYLVLPLFVRVEIISQVHALLGLNVYYLFTSTDNIATTETYYSTVLSSSSHKGHGYTQGYLLYDAGLMAGAEWNFFKGFSAGVYFNYGLLNITDKTYFGNSPAFKNNSIQFMIRYHLFNR